MSIGDIIQGKLQTDYMIVMNVSWEEDAMRCSWEEDGMMKVSSVLKFVGGLYDVGSVFGIIVAAPVLWCLKWFTSSIDETDVYDFYLARALISCPCGGVFCW